MAPGGNPTSEASSATRSADSGVASSGLSTTEQPADATEQPPAGTAPASGQAAPPAGGQPQTPAGTTPPAGATEQPAAEHPATEPPAAAAQVAGNFKYIGVAGCAVCHRGASKGAIFEQWQAAETAAVAAAFGPNRYMGDDMYELAF